MFWNKEKLVVTTVLETYRELASGGRDRTKDELLQETAIFALEKLRWPKEERERFMRTTFSKNYPLSIGGVLDVKELAGFVLTLGLPLDDDQRDQLEKRFALIDHVYADVFGLNGVPASERTDER